MIDHVARPGPMYWDFKCMTCDELVRDHPNLLTLLIRKVQWAWYLWLLVQVTWLVYFLVTAPWGFFAGVLLFSIIHARSAVRWIREHRAKKVD